MGPLYVDIVVVGPRPRGIRVTFLKRVMVEILQGQLVVAFHPEPGVSVGWDVGVLALYNSQVSEQPDSAINEVGQVSTEVWLIREISDLLKGHLFACCCYYFFCFVFKVL